MGSSTEEHLLSTCSQCRSRGLDPREELIWRTTSVQRRAKCNSKAEPPHTSSRKCSSIKLPRIPQWLTNSCSTAHSSLHNRIYIRWRRNRHYISTGRISTRSPSTSMHHVQACELSTICQRYKKSNNNEQQLLETTEHNKIFALALEFTRHACLLALKSTKLEYISWPYNFANILSLISRKWDLKYLNMHFHSKSLILRLKFLTKKTRVMKSSFGYDTTLTSFLTTNRVYIQRLRINR